MAWQYTDWSSQATQALRLSRLRLHVAEVSAAIETRADSVAENGKSITRPQLLLYYQSLVQQLSAAESSTRGRAGGRVLYRPASRGS